MRHVALSLAVPAQCMAGTLSCVLTDPDCADCAEIRTEFFVDPTLADARNIGTTPRTMVTFGDARFAAEPILMRGGVRGFHEVGPNDAEQLMIVQADGRAAYHNSGTGRTMTGQCEDKR